MSAADVATLVFTAIGDDRPGLVELLAATVSEHGGNWIDSRMSRLAGQFVGIVRVEVPAEAAPSLRYALASLTPKGLQVVAVQTEVPDDRAGEGLTLEILGNDRPGIVRSIAAVLSRHGVNVEALSSEVGPAPMSGEPMFKAVADVWVPPGVAVDDLLASLEALAAEVMVEITFKS